ncbi:MAG: alpha/beta fold hydrolase [Deltaproteobacteria bacterium]|nr:alpha/beta fold hydrolase [Deltaproteobacteria bacterium]MBW2257819.1 alpha/beta fold hydrolase [Deltaproteobacteria bacterium]
MLEVITREPHAETRGPPLLFVHGAWHGAWCWDAHFLPYFAGHGYRSHALSLRAHGESPGKLRGSRIADYVADVAEVAKTLAAPPVLIGHCMGGFVVQKYLEKHPARGALLLASVPPTGVLGVSLRIAWRHPVRFAAMNLKRSLYPLVSDTEIARAYLFSPAMRDDAVKVYQKHLGDESYRAYLDMLLTRCHPGRVKVSVAVVGAEEDALITPKEVWITARAYNTVPTLFHDIAHDVMLEPGWREVADFIRGWLKRLEELTPVPQRTFRPRK